MKKLGVFLVAALVFVSCQKKNVIEVTVENVPDNTKVEVLSRDLGKDVPTAIAEGVIVGGKLTLENPFTEVDEAFLSINESEEAQHTVFFLGEPGAITIKFDSKKPEKPVIGGTENNEKLQKFQEEINPFVEKLMTFLNENGMKMMMMGQTGEGDPAELKKLQDEYDALSAGPTKIVEKFEADNKGKALGLLMLYQKINSQEKSPAEYKADFDTYPADLKATKLGKKVAERLSLAMGEEGHDHAEVKGLSVGDKLPEFKASTPDGKEVTLTSFLQGKKLVLVDVWASWCGPCRQENPNVVKAYNAFNAKGFDIIGYSIDKDDAAWKKAIEMDKLTWTQVSNLKFWEDPIIAAYGIEGIPANYLVDATGTIIEMNLRGEDLSKKIEEVLAK